MEVCGEEGLIIRLEDSKEDTIALILNGPRGINWQNPNQVRNYILNNWERTGTINIFDIYEYKGKYAK